MTSLKLCIQDASTNGVGQPRILTLKNATILNSNAQLIQAISVRTPRTISQATNSKASQMIAIPIASTSGGVTTATPLGIVSPARPTVLGSGKTVEQIIVGGRTYNLQQPSSPIIIKSQPALIQQPQQQHLTTPSRLVIHQAHQTPQQQLGKLQLHHPQGGATLSPSVGEVPQSTPAPTPRSTSKASYITPILDRSGSRKRLELEDERSEDLDQKRRRTAAEKTSKGLRHFSMKVCEKVQRKMVTTYNEVADELVSELSSSRLASPIDSQYDQKNIRRRVYDALNVLMAMGIITKERKEIRWQGLPTNTAQECQTLRQEIKRRQDRIRIKKSRLQELLFQQIALKNLCERNRETERLQGGPPPSNTIISTPFVVVLAEKTTEIDCRISYDKMEYLFMFNDLFVVNDDIEVLKRMGMTMGLESGSCTEDNLRKACSMVPKALEPYLLDLAKGKCEEVGSHIKEEEESSSGATSTSAASPIIPSTSTSASALGSASMSSNLVYVSVGDDGPSPSPFDSHSDEDASDSEEQS
ncbi:unnamed protein product [Darwinula stevensoni]|uniref:Transcription factor n=1 Tax=Darwinula stevensoni TaxID=69355 RepID=A0A7R8X884_9CRUS|nr:unnamed protein product [Darwinula stevensoni]CAG0881307.1 unnamed protein product [Darwinula stevensoni]